MSSDLWQKGCICTPQKLLHSTKSIATLSKGMSAGKENLGLGGLRCELFLSWQDWYYLRCRATSLYIVVHQLRSQARTNVAFNARRPPDAGRSTHA